MACTGSSDRRRKMVGNENVRKIDFSGEKPATPLLDTINYPVHLKNLSTQVSSWEEKHRFEWFVTLDFWCKNLMANMFFFG